MGERLSRLRRGPWKLRYEVGGRLASRARQVLIAATHLHCRVELQGPVHFGPGFSLFIPDHGSLIVGPHVQFRHGFVCEIHGDGIVRIGAGTVFTYDAVVQCSTSIDIGERCVFAQSTMIVDGNHRYRDPEVDILDQGYDFRPIRIGDGALVLSKATVTNDVGTRAVVGANSVVTKPIPAFSLAVGAPAKVISYFGPREARPAEHVGES
jgi:acetyltransferase-like isoleucine patch superfamily enzyme